MIKNWPKIVIFHWFFTKISENFFCVRKAPPPPTPWQAFGLVQKSPLPRIPDHTIDLSVWSWRPILKDLNSTISFLKIVACFILKASRKFIQASKIVIRKNYEKEIYHFLNLMKTSFSAVHAMSIYTKLLQFGLMGISITLKASQIMSRSCSQAEKITCVFNPIYRRVKQRIFPIENADR